MTVLFLLLAAVAIVFALRQDSSWWPAPALAVVLLVPVILSWAGPQFIGGFFMLLVAAFLTMYFLSRRGYR